MGEKRIMTDEQKLKIANDAFNAATRQEVLLWKQNSNIPVSEAELEEAGEAEVKTVKALLELLLGRTPTDDDLDKVNVR